MSERTTKASLPSITARPSAAEKARFTWLADRAGMSESELALLAIRSFIDPDGKTPPSITQAMERLAATDRMTIRLRPGDGTTIAHRAAARGIKVSAYVAALVRSHVRASPPFLPPSSPRSSRAWRSWGDSDTPWIDWSVVTPLRPPTGRRCGRTLPAFNSFLRGSSGRPLPSPELR